MGTVASEANQLAAVRNTRPRTAAHLWHWVKAYTGVHVGRAKVCREHSPPLEWLAALFLTRPPLALVLGSRGSGKSFLTAVATHLESRFTPRLGTRILGGSKAQSAQIYEALEAAIVDGSGAGGSDADTLAAVLKTETLYHNGSKVSILAASSTSVRGPHVASLRLDEVDEILPDLRESAVGMSMDQRGVSGAISMASTWHRTDGPMGGLVARGRAGEFPVWTTCILDVLERCPEARSGPYVGGHDAYRDCPQCPVVAWCHAERDRNGGIPLAKLADGHYSIGSMIQKVQTVSARIFQADYLCSGPRPDGIWFTQYGAANVSESAEYDPLLPVHISIDSGVWTGAVALQIRPRPSGLPLVSVFADYLSEGLTAEDNAKAILERIGSRVGTKRRISTDQAGGSRNPIGPTVIAEYERSGMRGLERWPTSSVADSLAALEALVGNAAGGVSLRIHPRCERLRSALQLYRRKAVAGQWTDRPEDPQHPAEDLVDALRGAVKLEFPQGFRAIVKPARTIAARRVMY